MSPTKIPGDQSVDVEPLRGARGLRNRVVTLDSIDDPIKSAPGFKKKDLADAKLDIMGLCGFGCRYCSSNAGNYLRIRGDRHRTETLEQLGIDATPATNPALTFVWKDVLERMRAQLDGKRPGYGRGKTLVFSMLTDGFSPIQVADGTTRAALDLVLAHTEFRIRVLTKNAVVGTPEWIGFFRAHPGRFVVGLSTGTLDDQWALRVEMGTSSPTDRLRATQALQEAGIPTFGMLCPVFPDAMEGSVVEDLLDRVRCDRVETVWAEPYNDRQNFEAVRKGYRERSSGYEFLTAVFERKDWARWSRYATDLYLRVRAHADRHGWLPKLRYLLYEEDITAEDVVRLGDMAGIWFQGKPAEDGFSANPHVAARQRALGWTA